MRIVLHLGLMKTGTTSIQETLRQNADRLRGEVAILAYDPGVAAVRRWGQRLHQGGDAEAEAPFRAALAALRARLEREGAPAAIVSDENVYCRKVHAASGDLFGWTRLALPRIAAAFDGHDVVFAFYVREPEAWARSAWQQMVKRARCVEDFAAWRARLPFALDWDARFREVAEAAGARLALLDMDAEAAEGRLGAGLLRLAGLDDDDLASIAWAEPQNAGLPDGAIDFMRKVNASGLDLPAVLKVSELVESTRDLFTGSTGGPK